jgi:hypothetical protein
MVPAATESGAAWAALFVDSPLSPKVTARYLAIVRGRPLSCRRKRSSISV